MRLTRDLLVMFVVLVSSNATVGDQLVASSSPVSLAAWDKSGESPALTAHIVGRNLLDVQQNFALEDPGSTDWWPMFHHDAQASGFSHSTAPSTNEIYWIAMLGQLGVSSPVVADEMVFTVEQFTPYPRSFFNVFALDEPTGDIVWSYPVHDGDAGNMPQGGEAVAVAYGKVFLGSYGPIGGTVYALDQLTGDLVWSYRTGSRIWAAPVADNRKVFVGSTDHKLYAFNESTGAILWDYTTGSAILATPAVAEGIVYALSDDGKLYALNEVNGSIVWTFSTNQRDVGGGGVSVSGNAVFVGDNSGWAWALDASTGEVLWSRQLPSLSISKPSVGYGKVFFSDHTFNAGTKIYALNKTNGETVWTMQGGEGPFSSAAVADGKVFIGGDGKLYSLNEADGTLLWSYSAGMHTPAVATGKVFAASSDGRLYSFGHASPMALESFTVRMPVFVTEPANFTASWTGGVGVFYCRFDFGDGTEPVYVRSRRPYCSATQTYASTGEYAAGLEVLGWRLGDYVTMSIPLAVEPEPMFARSGLSWKKHVSLPNTETFKFKARNPSMVNLQVGMRFLFTRPNGTSEVFVAASFALSAGQLRTDMITTYAPSGGLGEYCFLGTLYYGVDLSKNGILEDSEVLGSADSETGCFTYA